VQKLLLISPQSRKADCSFPNPTGDPIPEGPEKEAHPMVTNRHSRCRW